VPNRLPQSVQTQDFFIALAGGPVAARRIRPTGMSGNGEPVLVFLHEALGCIAMWRDVPAQLSRMTGLPALLYDRHGHGRSAALPGSRDPDYLEREALEILPQVLAAVGIVDAILIGHSDGGSIALIYASRYPVRAVVTEAAHVFVEDVTLAGIRDAVEAWRGTALSERLARYHGDKTDALFLAWADTWLSDEFASWNIEDGLPRIACPVLAVQGEDDEYGSLRQVDAIVNGISGPAQSLVLPDCRHIPHLQAEDRLLPSIAAFVADCLG
jgi:pimeloyl-ACP methyl ester carboxylesterase